VHRRTLTIRGFAQRGARTVRLDPEMPRQAWDRGTAVAFDKRLRAELASLRFLSDAYNVLVMGPVGVGKTFLANVFANGLDVVGRPTRHRAPSVGGDGTAASPQCRKGGSPGTPG
jgi:hypothetical protein